jgi:hypothetical protein
MRVWFMRDNHTFARVGDGTVDRATMQEKARQLFALDPYGIVFARDCRDHEIAHASKEADLPQFFDRIDEHTNWEARG